MREPVTILVITVLAQIIFFFQAIPIMLYRSNVQKPVSALVGRMKAVDTADFRCKASALYAGELGQLKGHFKMLLHGLMAGPTFRRGLRS